MELEKLFNYNSILTIQTIAMFLGFIRLPEVSEIVFLKTEADLRNMKIKCVYAWTFFPRLVQRGLHTFAAAELNGLWWLLRKASRAASNLQQRFSVAGGGGGRGL